VARHDVRSATPVHEASSGNFRRLQGDDHCRSSPAARDCGPIHENSSGFRADFFGFLDRGARPEIRGGLHGPKRTGNGAAAGRFYAFSALRMPFACDTFARSEPLARLRPAAPEFSSFQIHQED